jgi:predicted nuclease of restriction endonuclease-like RecB superfamily
MRAVMDEYESFAGAKRLLLHERLQKPLPVRCPRGKLAILRHVLDRFSHDDTTPPIDPPTARHALFRAARYRHHSRAEVVAEVARELGVLPLDLEACLFADLPREERVGVLRPMTPEELVLEANFAIASTLLRRALRVRIHAHGHVRALVRHAQRSGLICRADVVGPDSVELDVSGPFALFRHTILYSRSLANLLGALAQCHDWELEATCSVEPAPTLHRLLLSNRDPLPARTPSSSPTTRLEARFVLELGKLTSEWDVVADPQAIGHGRNLFFPDLELLHRERNARFFLEIVGFSTREYVEKKLALLKEAGLDNYLLCIDTERECGAEPLRHDTGPNVIGYRRRIDAARVLALIEAREGDARSVA